MTSVNLNTTNRCRSHHSCISALGAVTVGIVTGLFFHAWNWIISLGPENANRRNLLNKIAAHLADPTQSPVAQLYYRDLKERVTATKKMQDPTQMCKAFQKTSNQYQDLASRVEQAVMPRFNLESTVDPELLYKEALDELKNLKNLPITETERAIYTGRITQAFRKLDNTLGQENGRPLHKFCGCHILEENQTNKPGLEKFTVPYPSEMTLDTSLQGKSALLQSWSLGGGHNVAQRGIAQRLRDVGMHAYLVEADNETLRRFDTLAKLTQDRYFDADLLRWLMKKNCWKILRFINWVFSGKPSAQKYQAMMDEFMRSILFRGAPELHMTIFARNALAAANAAGKLGSAAANVATDLVSDFYDIETPTDIENPHFVNMAMVNGEKVLAQANKVLGINRTVITGFPVRQAFLQEYDVAALRETAGIDPDARVVILCSGGEGVENGYAQYIINQYQKKKNLPKIHLVVLCGRNTAQKNKLETQFSSLNHCGITVQIQGWTDEEELAKFYAMAADPKLRGALISTKGGGGTLSEGLASQVPMLLGSSDDIEWEKMNIDFVCENSCGLRFKAESDLMQCLEDLFHMDYRGIKIDSKQASLASIRNQIHAAEADAAFQMLRANALNFTPAL